MINFLFRAQKSWFHRPRSTRARNRRGSFLRVTQWAACCFRQVLHVSLMKYSEDPLNWEQINTFFQEFLCTKKKSEFKSSFLSVNTSIEQLKKEKENSWKKLSSWWWQAIRMPSSRSNIPQQGTDRNFESFEVNKNNKEPRRKLPDPKTRSSRVLDIWPPSWPSSSNG